ncbi:MAG: IS3 family transposase [Candidatus Sungiibacteriota bacterium]
MIERAHPTISISRQAKLLDLSRTSLYTTPKEDPRDKHIMDCIDRIYTKHPFLGSRKIRMALDDEDIHICRDHVRRLMRVMGIEAIYPKKYKGLSDPDGTHKKYPYLLTNITASFPNHIWGTDITYVKLESGFCYLVVLLDWFSRYVIAWQLSETLEIEFCLENLERGLAVNIPDIHNSDQGSHFTSPRYTDLLTQKNVQISMDGRGRCMDNIFTERLWRTVKYEDVYLKSYRNLEEAQHGLTEYFRFYNTERRHQALGYLRPADVYFKKS